MAMIKNNRITFSLVLVCLISVSPMAKAQLTSSLPLLGGILCPVIMNVNGLVSCTMNGAPSATSPLPFVDAAVQLRCGTNNLVVANTTTNVLGLFSLATSGITLSLLPNCTVAVVTPLSSCNPSLPSVGSLVSGITPVSSTLTGLVTTIVSSVTGFVRML